MPSVEGGCKWNNDLSHEIFKENVGKFGEEKAIKLLRNDIRSWVRERDGKKFKFSYRVKDESLVHEELGKSITGMIEDSIYTHGDTVATNVKENAPLELAIAQEATKRAIRGDQEIRIPEYYRTTSGETVIRYITVLTKDANNKRLYHGDRIDLGQNYSVEEALKQAGEHVVIPIKSRTKVTPEPIQPQYSTAHAIIRETPRVFLGVVSGVSSEMSFTARSVQRYIEKRNKGKRKEKRILVDPQSVDIWKRVIESGKKRMRRVVRAPLLPGELTGNVRKKYELKKKPERQQKSGVPERNAIPVINLIDKSIARHERKLKKVKVIQEMNKRIKVLKENRPVYKNEKRLFRVLRNERKVVNRENLQSKKQMVVKEIVTKQRVDKKSAERVMRLSTLLKKLIRVGEHLRLLNVKYRKEYGVTGIEKRLRKHDYIRTLSIAMIFRILTAEYENIQFPDSKQNTGKLTETLTPHEPSSWLLLAIIWYLVMIRESRGAGSGVAGQVKVVAPLKKQSNKFISFYPLPSQGVIFASAA